MTTRRPGPTHSTTSSTATSTVSSTAPAVASTTGQAVLALAFGLGVFYAFGKLWAWNSLLALVLTVLVTLGMVAAVQAVRRTVDIVSTLMAVAVGLGLTLGPLALQAR